MPTLHVRLFAILREHAGQDRLELDVPAGTTTAQLKELVRTAAPGLGPYMDATRVAVNLAFAPPEQVLAPGDDVALIPPVGGG
ncbi:MAG: moaE [Cyanobacteria bacterium RYN_339]|nr:moaE [Cyanobacteria bacterium RYN_339]